MFTNEHTEADRIRSGLSIRGGVRGCPISVFPIFASCSFVWGAVMTAIVRYIEKAGLGGVFDDSATKVMGEAFDAACKDLHDTGQPDIVYEVVATRIIEAAKSGERDPDKLRDWALTAFGRKKG
jgi:hypothetical protein